MGQNKETAEEQLLRMIEGGRGQRPPGRGRAMMAGWREAVHGLVEQVRRFMVPGGQPVRASQGDVLLIRLHAAERIVWVLLIGLGVYLLADLMVLKRHLPALSLPSNDAEPFRGAALAGGQLRPLNAYRETIVSRNPFNQRTGRPTTADGDNSKLQALTSGLVVVGINRGRIPEALIEDSAAKRTYFVRVGDTLNGMTITSIDSQGVAVAYENEEAILP